jgi:aryl-alcohol dehydrogenase-like predicted oxidoreductase
MASARAATPAQLTRAWVHPWSGRLGVPVVPIPGTKRVSLLEETVAAPDMSLTADEMAIRDSLADSAVGDSPTLR